MRIWVVFVCHCTFLLLVRKRWLLWHFRYKARLVTRSSVPLMYKMKSKILIRLSPKDQPFHPRNAKVRRHALT